ncbi:hypothetical protein BGZ94_007267 [Podila epigama]|nr:hypothetical protein BGZ94_007267 [Podila epigama]
MTSGSAPQDAYGGTSNDWRSTLQQEKQVFELNDGSPTERAGHSSINSVSTLNLPPMVTPPHSSAIALNRSMSRILLPDRDRGTSFTDNKSSLIPQDGIHSTRSLIHDSPTPEPTQENTSLAKATVQPGGILNQLQAATEAGHVIDPAAGIWSAREGRYIQRSNTAPYPSRENRTIMEEDETGSSAGQKPHVTLVHSKSEGNGLPHSRQQRAPKARSEQQQQQMKQDEEEAHNPSQPYAIAQPSATTDIQGTHSHSGHSHSNNSTNEQSAMDRQHSQHSQRSQSHNHRQPQRSNNALMKEPPTPSESAVDISPVNADTNKDLPPTPLQPVISSAQPTPVHDDMVPTAREETVHIEKRHEPGNNSQRPRPPSKEPQERQQRQQPPPPQAGSGPRSRSDSRPEASRPRRPSDQTTHHHPQGAAKENVHARSTSPSHSRQPPGRQPSRERAASGSQTQQQHQSHRRGASSGQSAAGSAQKGQFGIDMLPLPVIPSPDETLNKDANVGILPQNVLRTVDLKTVQKVITESVIASRVYKFLSAEEVASLKKEQDDLQKYVEALDLSLAIETRMRDASHSLIRLHEGNTNIDAVKASTGQLHATTRKMDQIVQKSKHSMQRLIVIERMLLQHEGAVLNAGMRRLDAENRELSRTVLELETVRDKEKEEKNKWKKEHTQLRIQSMIFPNPPGLDQLQSMMAKSKGAAAGDESHLPTAPGAQQQVLQNQRRLKEQQQQQQLQQKQTERLNNLEKYMKELNEEIHKKDERVQQLESQLRLVKAWLHDFAMSAQLPVGTRGDITSDNEPLSLQNRMQILQTRIENGFKDMETVIHDLKQQAQAAEEAKNAALEFTATTLANSLQHNGPGRQSPPHPDQTRSSSTVLRRTRSRQNESSDPRIQSQESSVRPRTRSKSSHVDPDLDLDMVLNESLLELDIQLSRDHGSSSSPSNNSNSSSSLGGDSSFTSTSPLAFHSSSGDQQSRKDLNRRTSRSKQRLEQQQLKKEQQEHKHHHYHHHHNPQQPQQHYQQEQQHQTLLATIEPKSELDIIDPHEEIKRLNATVDALERFVRLKMQQQ